MNKTFCDLKTCGKELGGNYWELFVEHLDDKPETNDEGYYHFCSIEEVGHFLDQVNHKKWLKTKHITIYLM